MSFSKGLLFTLWLLAVVGSAGGLFYPVKWLDFLIGLASGAFIIALIWIYSREKPAETDLPDMEPATQRRLGFGASTVLIMLGLGFTFSLGLTLGTGFSSMLVCSLLGLGITGAWRKFLFPRILWLGLGAGLVSVFGIAFLGNGDFSWALANLITIPSAFIGGILLIQCTGLGRVQLVEGELGSGFKGFLPGSFLAIPAAFMNLMGNIQGQDTWVVHGWQPLYAIIPAIAKESWARLFLVSFCYAVLRPVTNQRPRRAVIIAMLVSLLAHGFAHSGTDSSGILIGSALYSLPTALLFIKHDIEHAFGYHFLIDFVRFVSAFWMMRA